MSLDYVMKSIELGKAGLIDVVSTAPIHKEAIKLAGCKLPGHTEIYQVETQSDYGLTMFHVQKLRVFFVSRHMALKAACDYANKERVLACVQQIHHEFTALKIANPRIAVAALNPHASDNGLFGHEEADNLIPAVKAAQEMGINAIGPVPAASRDVMTRSFPCTTTRGISPAKPSTLNAPLLSPSACRLFAAPLTTGPLSILPVLAKQEPSACWNRRWSRRVTGK